MPDERIIVVAIRPARVLALLRDAATIVAGLVLIYAWLLFGFAWAGV